jgi:hypothetical protein
MLETRLVQRLITEHRAGCKNARMVSQSLGLLSMLIIAQIVLQFNEKCSLNPVELENI